MADIIFKQTLEIEAGFSSNTATISNKELEINDVVSLNDFNESTKQRFILEGSAIRDVCPGTVSSIVLVMVKPATSIKMSFSSSGTWSPYFTIKGGVWSVMHMACDGIRIENPTTEPIRGQIYLAGD